MSEKKRKNVAVRKKGSSKPMSILAQGLAYRPHIASTRDVSLQFEARVCALMLLWDVQQGYSLQNRLPARLDDLDERNRPFAHDLIMGTLRHYLPLQKLISGFLRSPLKSKSLWIESLLVMGAYQLLLTQVPARAVIHSMVELVRIFEADHLTGLVNGVLRSISRLEWFDQHRAFDTFDEKIEIFNQFASLSKTDYLNTDWWLIYSIEADWPEHFMPIMACFRHMPPLYLRVNTQKSRVEDYIATLKAQNIEISTLPENSYPLLRCVRLNHPQNVSSLPGYDQGAFSVQDYSAQLITTVFVEQMRSLGMFAQSELKVLDACAAPGGKTIGLIDELPATAHIHATDIDAGRLMRVQENLDRLDLDLSRVTLLRVDLTGMDEEINFKVKSTQYDAILLDAPCSGTGVIARHPDIFWCRKQRDIGELVRTQRALLTQAYERLRPGGILMYSTCSILKVENVENLAWFQEHFDFPLEELLLPEGVGMKQAYGYQRLPLLSGEGDPPGDGFYFSVFRKLE